MIHGCSIPSKRLSVSDRRQIVHINIGIVKGSQCQRVGLPGYTATVKPLWLRAAYTFLGGTGSSCRSLHG